jgi:hypothetical protein
LRQNQSGSAIVMLFIAVALFGALAYAFMKGSRTSTGMLTGEVAKSNAQSILDFGNQAKGAIKRLDLRGCKDDQFSFQNTAYTSGKFTSGGSYANPNAPTNGSCDLFSAQGGGLRFEDAQRMLVQEASAVKNWPPFFITGSDNIPGIGTDCAFSSCVDITLSTWGIARETCILINDQLGIANPGGEPPGGDIYTYPNFDGTYHYNAPTVPVSGKYSACIKPASCNSLITGGCYVFFQVLLPR